MGCGSIAGAARRIRVVGAWRRDAAGGRQLCVFARGLWAGAHGPDDVVSVCVADADSGAVVAGVGCDWVFAIRVVFISAGEIWREGAVRRAGARAHRFVVSTDRVDRANLVVFVGGSDRDDSVVDLGRCNALPAKTRLYV